MRTISLLPDASHKVGLPSANLLQTLVVVLVLMMVIAIGWLNMMKGQLQRAIADEQKKKSALEEKIKHTNQSQRDLALILDRQKAFQGLAPKRTNFARVINGLAVATPVKLRIGSININDDGKIPLSGTAATRNDVSLFISHLNQVGLFTDVVLNQANTAGTDVSFSLSVALIGTSPSPAPTTTPSPSPSPTVSGSPPDSAL